MVRVTVESAVRRELRALKVRLPGSSLAATAVALAGEIDDPETSAAASAAAARELRLTMDAIRAGAVDGRTLIDEIAARRTKRRLEAYG